jgi:hypothetical protein
VYYPRRKNELTFKGAVKLDSAQRREINMQASKRQPKLGA